MTSCSGCGCVLGFRKYKFHKMWRIPGYYCKQCMVVLGRDFDENGRLTLPQRPCDLCRVEVFFPKGLAKGGRHGTYCAVCREAVRNGAVRAGPGERPVPQGLPHVMMALAGLGVLMMALGLVFTLSSSGEASLANILFGSVTTALGFLLFRRTVRSRSLLVGRAAAAREGSQ